jgi:ParB-like nuclease domain.
MRRQKLHIDQLTVDQVQSRDTAWVGDDEDQRLANSIAATGLLHDVVVRPLDGSSAAETGRKEYALVSGSRRYYAAI